MVHDPRVTTLLSRLGGLYRDPSRVDRDASSLLKSSVGVHLTPGIAPLVENNGDSSHCLVLQGTIAIVFRGMTYQLLVDIYLPPGYPIRPPVAFVRLAPNMYLKENHPHVGSDGMVYLPYTHEWNPRTHSLIEMVVAMSSVFSADPPCFTRSTPAPAPAPATNSDPPPPAYSDAGVSSNNTDNDEERYMREQIAAIMAKEAEDANRVAEIARQAAREDEKREKQAAEQAAAQKVWQEKKMEEVKEQVTQKISIYLAKVTEETKVSAQSDWRDQEQLKASKKAIAEELERLQKTKEQLQQHISVVDTKTEEIEQWLEESKNSEQRKEADVDEICQPVSKSHAQMLDLSAENAALTDVLYFLDRGMYMGQMDCNTHLKSVRKLAKSQFLVRAHLIKIGQTLKMR